ncbi:MAG: SAM-dependent methyltransferase, partial [Cyanobacteria bacterium P01_D01_bin.71]
QHPEVSIQTVPGVCSPLAAVAQLGKPLTIWQQQLVVLPALYAIADFEAALNQADVVVLMKVASVYSVVWSVLQRRQLLHRSHVVVRATQSEERIYSDLRHHADLQLPYFSLMIIYCGQTDSAAEGNT